MPDHYRLPGSVWLRPTGAGYFDTHREKPTRGEGHDHAVEFVPAALIEALEADRARLAAIVERCAAAAAKQQGGE